MKIREYAKAAAALLGAIVTFLISIGAPAEWATWLGGIAAVVTGVATLGIPNAASATTAEKTVTSLQDVQAELDAAKQTAANHLDSLTQQAIDNVTKIQNAIGGAAGSLPAVGPLAQQVIDLSKRI